MRATVGFYNLVYIPDDMVVSSELIYPVAVTLGTVILYYTLRFFINRSERRSVARLNRVRFPTIARNRFAPEAVPVEEKRKDAIESVDNQFSIIRRTFFSIIFIIWLSFILFPYMGHVSAGLVSVLAGGAAVLIGIAKTLRKSLTSPFSLVSLWF